MPAVVFAAPLPYDAIIEAMVQAAAKTIVGIPVAERCIAEIIKITGRNSNE